MPLEVRTLAIGHGQSQPKEAHYVASQFHPHEIVQVNTSGPQRHGVFKAVNRTSAGTTIITSPDGLGAIVVTDLLISAKKAATSDVAVQFNGGGNTVIIFLADSINSDFNLAIPFVGLFRGWQDADLELVTTGNVVATVTAGYMKVPDGLPFSEWDALR